MSDPVQRRPADDLFVGARRCRVAPPVPRPPVQSLHARHRAFEQHDREPQQGGGTEAFDQECRDGRPKDCAQGPRHADQAEEPAALPLRVDVGHEGPEDRDHEQTEDGRPDEERPPGPDRRLTTLRQRVQQDVVGDQTRHEEAVGHRDETPPRPPGHERGEDGMRQQHRRQRTREEPRNVLYAPGDAHLLAYRPDHVVRRQHAEEVAGGEHDDTRFVRAGAGQAGGDVARRRACGRAHRMEPGRWIGRGSRAARGGIVMSIVVRSGILSRGGPWAKPPAVATCLRWRMGFFSDTSMAGTAS